MSEAYKFIPLQETQSIPVRWRFTREDYDRLVEGHRSNWSVLFRDNTVHICSVSGEEFYRFTVNKTDDGAYTTTSLEVYIASSFYESAKKHGWSKEKIKQHQTEFKDFVVEEVLGFLRSFFAINVDNG